MLKQLLKDIKEVKPYFVPMVITLSGYVTSSGDVTEKLVVVPWPSGLYFDLLQRSINMETTLRSRYDKLDDDVKSAVSKEVWYAAITSCVNGWHETMHKETEAITKEEPEEDADSDLFSLKNLLLLESTAVSKPVKHKTPETQAKAIVRRMVPLRAFVGKLILSISPCKVKDIHVASSAYGYTQLLDNIST
jgi:hypothetical protein